MKQTRAILIALAGIALALTVAKFLRPSALQQNQDSGEQTPNQPSVPISFVTPSEGDSAEPKFAMIAVDNQEFSVEVSRTQEEIQTGLSGRTDIGSDGMLFVINPPRIPTFWMKGMLFPLDILWIRDNQIVHIDHDVPMFIQEVIAPPLYQPPTEVNYVLELPAGVAKTYGFKVGTFFSIQKRGDASGDPAERPQP